MSYSSPRENCFAVGSWGEREPYVLDCSSLEWSPHLAEVGKWGGGLWRGGGGGAGRWGAAGGGRGAPTWVGGGGGGGVGARGGVRE